jgi:hypothetical protein
MRAFGFALLLATLAASGLLAVAHYHTPSAHWNMGRTSPMPAVIRIAALSGLPAMTTTMAS